MPFATNNGVKIYYEIRGAGEPLLLHHGLTFNSILWAELGYTRFLENNYRLIQIDARGHGRSDKPHKKEDYSTEIMVKDVISVLDALGIESTHFFGYSMGGKVGLGCVIIAPERFRSLIIGGMGNLERDSKVLTESYTNMSNLFGLGMTANLAFLDKIEKITPRIREEWKNNDLEALSAYVSLRENFDFQEKLSKVSNPCLLFAGEEDDMYGPPAKQCAELMLNATFHSLPGDHIECLTNVRAITELISEFIRN